MRIALTLDRDASRAKTNDYVRSLRAAGFQREEIAVVGPGEPPPEDLDGLVLGGGCDVDPGRYGRPSRADARLELDSERDATDFALFDRAWRAGAPILAICRGLQVVNVALGGTLVQDIPTECPSALVHWRPEKEKTRRDHAVHIAAGTRLRRILGTDEVAVNSRHHQAVATAAEGLLVSARSPDGLIEGMEAESGRWLVAVQWHPENLAGDPASEGLFAEFERVVREKSAAHAPSSSG